MLVKLSDIFTPSSSKKKHSKEDLLQLEIKTEFVEGLAKSLKLLHLEDTSTENNLCYAFNEDVNPDYKLGLSKSDIRNHLKATLQPIETTLKRTLYSSHFPLYNSNTLVYWIGVPRSLLKTS